MHNYNFHTHHYRCKHASGEISEYVEEAIDRGLKYIGISCHIPYSDNRRSQEKMEFHSLDDYYKEIEEAKAKYSSQITVLSGLECEYFESYDDYYRELNEKYDYLILAQHYLERKPGVFDSMFIANSKEEIYMYSKQIERGANTGYFDFIAHPDICLDLGNLELNERLKNYDIVLKAAVENNMMIEYNVNGKRDKRKYPSLNFFKYVKDKYPELEILINSDCHQTKMVRDKYVDDSFRYMGDNNYNIVLDGEKFVLKL